MSEFDKVKHPAHYAAGVKYEPVKVICDWGLNFNLGNTIKYIARAGKKPGNDVLEDLEKARQYLTFEIRRIKGQDITEADRYDVTIHCKDQAERDDFLRLMREADQRKKEEAKGAFAKKLTGKDKSE